MPGYHVHVVAQRTALGWQIYVSTPGHMAYERWQAWDFSLYALPLQAAYVSTVHKEIMRAELRGRAYDEYWIFRSYDGGLDFYLGNSQVPSYWHYHSTVPSEPICWWQHRPMFVELLQQAPFQTTAAL